MMTGTVVAALAVCVYGLRATGFFVGDRLIRGRVRDVIEYLPMAIIAGVLALATFSAGGVLTLDARVPGMVVAGIAVWRKAPLALVILLAAATTALVRSFG